MDVDKGDNPYLWREIEPQVAAAGDVVLHQQRNLVGKADLDGVGEGRGLAEVDEVLEGEGQGDGLGELNVDVLLGLVDVGVAPERDGAVADVSRARELDTVLAGVDRN